MIRRKDIERKEPANISQKELDDGIEQIEAYIKTKVFWPLSNDEKDEKKLCVAVGTNKLDRLRYSYKPDRGTTFLQYAMAWVKQEMRFYAGKLIHERWEADPIDPTGGDIGSDVGDRTPWQEPANKKYVSNIDIGGFENDAEFAAFLHEFEDNLEEEIHRYVERKNIQRKGNLTIEERKAAREGAIALHFYSYPYEQKAEEGGWSAGDIRNDKSQISELLRKKYGLDQERDRGR